MEIEKYIEDVIPTSTNTDPRVSILHLTAKGNQKEIQWFGEMINKMFIPTEDQNCKFCKREMIISVVAEIDNKKYGQFKCICGYSLPIKLL
jgi:hypothetical protein